MTFLALTPTPQPKGAAAAPLNLTALLAAGTLGSDTGVEFVNDNLSVLYVEQGTTPSTIVVSIGATVEGQDVTSITYTGVASAIQMVGPFNTDFNVNPGGLVQVTFGTPADVAGVALVQNAGAY